MIGIKDLAVSTYDLGSLTVSWVYEHLPPGADLSTTQIDVHRSETEDFSSYDILATGLPGDTTTEYTDTTLSGIYSRRYADFNYRIKVSEADGQVQTTDFVWLTTEISLKAKDIIRRKDLSLKLHGVQTYFLKKKTVGTLCTECYDDLLEVQVDGNCTTCYNTTFVGGYYPAISQKAFITSTPDVNTINRFGEFNPGQLIYSVSSFPKLSVNDLIVDPYDKRWWVTQVKNISFQGYVVSQDAVLTLVDHNDVVKELAVT